MSAPSSPTLSDSALLDSLEDDPRFDLAAQREQRMEEIKEQTAKVKAMQERESAGWQAGSTDEGYGRVVTFKDEKTLLQRMSQEKYCLIHFFHPDFARCRIMDSRLDELAPRYPQTLFCRASVADVPFSVAKFNVKVLPDVHVFVDGRCVDRLIGFEDLGQSDTFTTSALEFRLQHSGVLPKGKTTLAGVLGRDPTGSDSEDERSDDETDDKARRRGKVGIRNGFASRDRDNDEWD